ncbi:MAG: hypothetical protein NXI15_13660 [Gammaproteobacteria bacterium]|nr:hypothetical protein [Gammaproteobacteria bacterium]
MLRATLLSLVLAIGATLAGLSVLHSLRAENTVKVPDIRLGADAFTVAGASGRPVDGNLAVELGKGSTGVVIAPLSVRAAEQYHYLVLNFAEIPAAVSVSLGWSAESGRSAPASVDLPVRARQSMWLQTSEIANWAGPIDNFGIIVRGQQGDTFVLEDVQFLNYSIWRQVRNIVNDWSNYDPWRRASMNSYTGVSKLSPFYPVVLVVCVLVLSLLLYGVWVLLFARGRGIDWRVPGLLFLVCWFTLDLVWQHKLLRQVVETHQQFAYKTTDEKLKAGPDAALYAFISAARAAIDQPDARVFVASTDNYTGLRSSYYLYPQNVYWVLRGPELPFLKYLQPGDYIVVAKPSDLKISRRAGLLFSAQRRLPVDIVHDSPVGTLVRLQ